MDRIIEPFSNRETIQKLNEIHLPRDVLFFFGLKYNRRREELLAVTKKDVVEACETHLSTLSKKKISK
jgi:hypothetical protein